MKLVIVLVMISTCTPLLLLPVPADIMKHVLLRSLVQQDSFRQGSSETEEFVREENPSLVKLIPVEQVHENLRKDFQLVMDSLRSIESNQKVWEEDWKKVQRLSDRVLLLLAANRPRYG